MSSTTRVVTISVVNQKLNELTSQSRPLKSRCGWRFSHARGSRPAGASRGEKNTYDTTSCSHGEFPLMPSSDYRAVALICRLQQFLKIVGIEPQVIGISKCAPLLARVNCSRTLSWALRQLDWVLHDKGHAKHLAQSQMCRYHRKAGLSIGSTGSTRSFLGCVVSCRWANKFRFFGWD